MVKIFVSYSQKDKEHKERFITHLESLNLHEADWQAVSETDIPPGSRWQQWLDEEMESSDIGVLLLSPDFLSSKYFKYEAETLWKLLDDRVVPVLVRDCEWDSVPELADFNLVNREPISVAPDLDRAWKDVAAKIRKKYRDAAKRLARRDIRSLPTTDSRNAKHVLADTLKKGGGAFTPILGSGVHDPVNRQRALDHVRARLAWLLQALTDEDASTYAKNVVKANLRGAEVCLDASERPKEPWSTDVID